MITNNKGSPVPPLRDYQQEALARMQHYEGRAALLVLATGLGKTRIFTEFLRWEVNENDHHCLILSHREELVHPFIVQTDEEILSDIENGYTGYVYFGYPTCPYCRNTVPVLIDVLKENGIEKVLYCNLKKYNYQFGYSAESDIVETQHGTAAYDSLLHVLSEYTVPKTIKDAGGNSLDTGVKTIYVPAVIKFENGAPVSCWQYKDAGLKLNNGQTIYDKWTDAQAELVHKSMVGILM